MSDLAHDLQSMLRVLQAQRDDLHADNVRLRAEIERLDGLLSQAVAMRDVKIERLRAADQTVKDLIEHHNKREAEIERLRAERADLLVALSKVASCRGDPGGIREWIGSRTARAKAEGK
jgi:DNA repair exonuclease SbcCD ATPase subunit